MKPIRTNACNTTLGAPQSWDTGQGTCVGLPAFVSDDPFVFSWWALTLRERLLLLVGRPIQLCVVGKTHAPVALEVGIVMRWSWLHEIKRLFYKKGGCKK